MKKKAPLAFETSGTTHAKAQRLIPGDQNPLKIVFPPVNLFPQLHTLIINGTRPCSPDHPADCQVPSVHSH